MTTSRASVRSRLFLACAAGLLAAGLAAGCSEPEPTEEELLESEAASSVTPILSPPSEHFKYGSIGADMMGVPVAVLKAIPIVCKDKLPPGADPLVRPFSAFGLVYEAGHDLPIGFSKRNMLGLELAGNNCSLCHTNTVRETPASGRLYYLGAPSTRFDIESYQQFLLDCIDDRSRFNTWTLNDAFNQLGVWGLERILAFKSSFLRAFIQDQKTKVESVVRDGAWGPGRDDAIGLSAALLLGRDLLPTKAAPVDFPAVWNQGVRRGHALHWDGASGSAMERNILVAVGAGTPKDKVPFASLQAVQSYLETLPVPKYPYAIDEALAEQGRPIFDARCNGCHGKNGEHTLDVTDISEIKTDPNRLLSASQEGIDKMNSLSGRGWDFSQFTKTNGYVNGLLDGIWLRAPYLHNGSVPTLRDLLKAPAERPKFFYRGNDVFDKTDVGFVSTVATQGSERFSLFDTTREGNSNAGHFGPAYGSDLTDAEIDALLEYLKTL